MLSSLFVEPQQTDTRLLENGFALLDHVSLVKLLGVPTDALAAWNTYWNDLPPDNYLRDGGHYRRRRHASFTLDGSQLERVPHRAHWQPVDYNALHGGMERLFEPMDKAWTDQPLWHTLLTVLSGRAAALRGAQKWFIEAHPFRIDTTDGIGRPTPEGAHRDGVDMVAVLLVGRKDIKGGESRVFQYEGPHGIRFTLTEPWSLLLLDDIRVIHETTPIQPEGDGLGHRDTLVLTFRSKGFLDPQ